MKDKPDYADELPALDADPIFETDSPPNIEGGLYDTEELLNLRDWLEQILTENRAEITDAGIGMGYADIGFTLDGFPYQVSVKPRPLPSK